MFRALVIFVSVPSTTWKDNNLKLSEFSLIKIIVFILTVICFDKREVVHSAIPNYGREIVEKIIYSFMFLLRSELPTVFFIFYFLKSVIDSAVLLVIFFSNDCIVDELNSLLCSIQVFLAC